MMEAAKVALLQDMQQALLRLLLPLTEQELSQQYHPDLSPLGWHAGHCAFIENLWVEHRADLRRVPGQDLYLPWRSPKAARGRRLPRKAELLDWVEREQRRHIEILSTELPAAEASALADFLAQHHGQHLETMQMVLAQRCAGQDWKAIKGAQLRGEPPSREIAHLPAGEYAIGCEQPGSYDNERPQRRLRLDGVGLSRWPVANAEFLAFMHDQGYQRRALWSDAGWKWRCGLSRAQPEHWRRDAAGGWLLLTPGGAQPLRSDEALLGISCFEAEAYAAWAEGRLPHEFEWEAATRLGLLQGVGTTWEWCSNRFHPYPGFRAFPYDEYSLPWFDGRHRVLRGGSRYTQSCLRRPSFRNFYEAGKRHVFAGCRVAFD